MSLSLSLPALAQEGGDEDTGVQVECGVPPAVREVQDLQEMPVGCHGSAWASWGPLRPWAHLPRAQGALQRALGWWQGGVRVLQPGQRRLVGVEVRGFIRRVEKPALENTGGTSPPNSPPAPRAQPQGASRCPGTPVRGACFSPSSPDPSLRAQFSPSCRKSPRRTQGRASGREHRSPSLRGEQGVGAGRAPSAGPIPSHTHLRSQSCRRGWCPGCGTEGARSAGKGGPTR